MQLPSNILENEWKDMKSNFDKKYGGFGIKPKFPTPHTLIFLLKSYELTKNIEMLNMAEETLLNMYKGDIFDHIGYGFSRYSVDNKWLIPHFEKMLYDNALLLYAYSESYSITKKHIYKVIAYNIFEYVKRELTHKDGGFYCGEDADSEGEEGKFYAWYPALIKDILGEEPGDFYNTIYGITPYGNFEKKSIPNLVDKDISLFEENYEKLEGLR